MEKLKAFAFGFFSDKQAEKAAKGGFGLFFINIIIAVALILLGNVLAETVSFYPRYEGATTLKATVDNLFEPQNSENAIRLFVDANKYVTAKRGGGEYAQELLVNTFSFEEDRAAYSADGFNIVVDTRDASLYDDFEAYYESKDGDGLTITNEEYSALSEAAKKGFAFKVRYTLNAVDTSDVKTEERETYLSENGKEQALKELKEKLSSGEIDELLYKNKVWALYANALYPELATLGIKSDAPLLRNYYYETYTLKGQTDYLFVFNDSIVGCFKTASGQVEEFYGFYENFSSGEITKSEGFIKTAYSSSVYLSRYVAFMNVMRFLPVYLVMPIVAALIAYLIIKIGEREKARKFLEVFGIISTYIAWSALFAAMATFALSFVISRKVIFATISVSFFVVLTIRSTVWFITDILKRKKEAENEERTDIEAA